MDSARTIALNTMLDTIAREDKKGHYIVPNEGRAEELGRFIAARIGAESGPTYPESQKWGEVKETEKILIFARSDLFARTALAAVEKLVEQLRAERAKRIEVAFHNTRDNPPDGVNQLGDTCLLAIRYVN